MQLFALFCLVALVVSDPFITPEFVSQVNNLATTWEAHENVGSAVHGATREQLKAMMGVLPGGPKLTRKTYQNEMVQALPTTFDSSTNWPMCASMKVIRDQSACGSCWAFAGVEAMSDRICIFKKVNVSLSSADLAFCCDSCGFGCGGGYPSAAWDYFQNTGIVEEGCWPYPFPSCDHHIPNSPNPCPSNEYPNPACATSCSSSWTGPSWNNDLHMSQSSYSVSGEADIMTEIYTNGPVEVAFTVYEDFVTYKSGVYKHTTGAELGGHAVKMMGWGVENGQKYWLVANSWNPHWGLNGFFKILRGTDECGIEDEADAGIPL
uniref:Peptidase C1A papain C-terminal domain-containing protein n=1 Tax=Arcella intermedia TaxID=1963864 RepID=A0A6B2LAF8_9EUKA|eukprot:TRINITY_DN23206_c0_g1_i1.p2 TRINITY_DN23206_c0_g1~~TRINITY_DN23206_c0_g1_i1.p2  ORF type:complete len:321 (-),score=57.06 TRINITY_DN23206_c0_g1_i1:29-991(-)